MVKKKPLLNAQLPATPVTTNMREKVSAIAENAGMSMAEVQRLAMSLFLSKVANEYSNIEPHDSKETA